MQTVTHILPWIQIAVSLVLILSILFQQTGAGLGGALGGGDSETNYRTRRGFEKFLFGFTIIIAVAFALTALAAIVL